MIGHQPVSFQHVLLVFQKAFLGQLTYLKTIELAQHLSSGFFVFLNPLAAYISTMKHSSVKCSLHTRTLSVFGGSTSRSFLNQVSLSLWSFGNLKKLNPFLSASLLEQSYVIQYTIVSRIHPKNMSHVWEIKTLCATGFTDT